MQTELYYQIALTLVPQIGPVQAKLLVEKFGSASEIFRAKTSLLEHTEGIGPVRAREIKQFRNFETIEKEIAFTEKFKIRPLFLKDSDYPSRLLHCYDPPTLLYYKGTANLNAARTVGIIGTRHNSDYGRFLTDNLVEGLKECCPLIVSGLAFGIDVLAHKASIRHQLPTIGVTAHGLDSIYPPQHLDLAREMIQENGGILTEFMSGTPPDRHNFPNRNRIVAGLCDAVVVVESGEKGGSMVTASLANGYHREVMAYPGRTIDKRSAGCNQLLQQQRAQLITGASDLLKFMNWENKKEHKKNIQHTLFQQLSPEEQILVNYLFQKEIAEIDEMQLSSGLNASLVAGSLLTLELKGLVRKLPGQRYLLL